jgi:orotate phosphoribosyltransferase
MDSEVKKCVIDLHDVGAFKFGSFTLKSGIISPIYIDLRVIVSYPQILRKIASLMWKRIEGRRFDCLCGVPYTALPIATVLSLDQDLPMLMRRKEVKDYGTKKVIEGVFQKGQNCLVIEDLVTTGSSIFDTIEPLEKEGLKVTDIIVLLDRQQGGKERISQKGYQLHSVLHMEDLLAILVETGRISSANLAAIDPAIGNP